MGGETLVGGPVELQKRASGYGELARVDVVRNGVVVHSELPDLGLPAGWLAVPGRVEWGKSDVTTDWTGRLSISGVEVLQTAYWSTDVTAADATSVSWASATKSFGHPNGSMRGGIEVTLVGPPEAEVDVALAHGSLQIALGKLSGAVVEVPLTGPGELLLQPGVGGLAGMGRGEATFGYNDDSGEPAFYYVRAFQTDGEMAWSSPIWVEAA